MDPALQRASTVNAATIRAGQPPLGEPGPRPVSFDITQPTARRSVA